MVTELVNPLDSPLILCNQQHRQETNGTYRDAYGERIRDQSSNGVRSDLMLISHIIALAVVEDPPDILEVFSKQRVRAGMGCYGRAHAFPSPALARTCTALEAIVLPVYYGQNTFDFRSASVAFYWLSQKRRYWREASVRRIRIHFPFDIPGKEAWRREELEVYLEEGTNTLAASVESPFYASTCKECWRALLTAIENENGVGWVLGSAQWRLAAVARYVDGRIRRRIIYEGGFDYDLGEGCTLCCGE